jgi:hypothetical protein
MTMSQKSILLVIFMILCVLPACSNSNVGGGDSGIGSASLHMLSAVPSADLSQLDFSLSSSNASSNSSFTSALALETVPAQLAFESWDSSATAVGGISRVGCDINMLKQEMTRLSQFVQLNRCYPEALEVGGLIAIPLGRYRYYRVPIPDSLFGKAKEMALRIGKVSGALQIDVCEGGILIGEATFTTEGSVYRAISTYRDTFGGQEEKMRFDMTADIGSDGFIDKGVINLGATGSVSVVANLMGGNGSGILNFEARGVDDSNKVYGAFTTDILDPSTETQSSFSNSIYSHFSDKGCARSQFSGSVPPMRVVDLIPFGMDSNDLPVFLQAFSNEIGFEITLGNYKESLLCSNPSYDSDEPASSPFVHVSSGEECDLAENDMIECFDSHRQVQQGDITTIVNQSFSIIENRDSEFFEDVASFDLGGLEGAPTEPVFVRNWDCTGAFELVDFDAVVPSRKPDFEAAILGCKALEEKMFSNLGMGGYDCFAAQHMNGISDLAETETDYQGYEGGFVPEICEGLPEKICHELCMGRSDDCSL